MKTFMPILGAILLPGCATTSLESACCEISYESSSSRIFLEDPAGNPVLPRTGFLVRIGNSFSINDGAIAIVPGYHDVGLVCPPTPGGLSITHGPSNHFKFEAGKKYRVKCEDGLVGIVQLDR